MERKPNGHYEPEFRDTEPPGFEARTLPPPALTSDEIRRIRRTALKCFEDIGTETRVLYESAERMTRSISKLADLAEQLEGVIS